ncbi:MAG TPA: DUF418 domain-containing protein, partial [Flavobacteriales bacterium]|nr:DUF418 domain-containing protein [Flavobacteriales bacterium]
QHDGLLQLFKDNFLLHRPIEWKSMVASGRMFQIGAWMMLGVAAGRHRLFEEPQRWSGLAGPASIAPVVGYSILALLPAEGPWAPLVGIWKETLMVIFYVSGVVLLSTRWRLLGKPTVLSAYGRMSLTNYLTQGLIGAALFYGFGFGLYRWGQTLSLLVGVVVFILQIRCTLRWQRTHRRGPLEELWAQLSSGWSTATRNMELLAAA